METLKRFFIATGSVVILALGVILIGNIRIGKDLQVERGVVVAIVDVGKNTYDIGFKLKDNGHHFYINRGLQAGLNIDTLRAALLNRQAEFFYNKTLINLGGHPIKKITSGGIAIFSR